MTAEVHAELAALKEKHPEVNFFWLELALADLGEETDSLIEELEELEGEPV